MIPPLPGLDELLGWAIDSGTSSVFDGIVAWMARGLAVLIEWIWVTLDSSATPRITEPWFTTELLGPIGLLALSLVVALMLASAIQAALAGRPEQILDAFKQAAWSLVATALSITVIDVLLGIVDAASAAIWAQARPDVQGLLEGIITAMTVGTVNGMGFLAVLMLLLMYLALIGLAVALSMRNALIYVTALMAPLVFASSVLPLFRESARKVVHLGVALIVSKLAIVATLSLAVKMMANATDIATTGDGVQDGAGALGVLFAGVVCFAVASITPMVLYKLMPTVEGAVVGAGVAGGWGRGAMTGMYAVSSAKNLGGSVTKLASGSVPGGAGPPSGSGGGGGGATSGGPGGSPSSGSPAVAPTPIGGASVGTGSGASGASGASGGASAAAGAVAVPIMIATAGIDAAKSGINRIGTEAAATTDASTGSRSGSSGTPASAGDQRSSSSPATDAATLGTTPAFGSGA